MKKLITLHQFVAEMGWVTNGSPEMSEKLQELGLPPNPAEVVLQRRRLTTNPNAYQVAKLAGVDPSQLYKIRDGQRKCSPDLAMKIDALGIPGWRYADLRPDIVEAVLKSVGQDHPLFPVASGTGPDTESADKPMPPPPSDGAGPPEPGCNPGNP